MPDPRMKALGDAGAYAAALTDWTLAAWMLDRRKDTAGHVAQLDRDARTARVVAEHTIAIAVPTKRRQEAWEYAWSSAHLQAQWALVRSKQELGEDVDAGTLRQLLDDAEDRLKTAIFGAQPEGFVVLDTTEEETA